MHEPDYRPGDTHRDPKLRRWVYLGERDAYGRPQWYRPPRFRRRALLLLALPVILVVRALWFGLEWLLEQHG